MDNKELKNILENLNIDNSIKKLTNDKLSDLFEYVQIDMGKPIVLAEEIPKYLFILLEGKVIQHGKTLDVYNKPNNLDSAKVFSDPPMNIAEINKKGEVCSLLTEEVNWKTNLNLRDGKYKVGIRPHNITTYKEGKNSIEINGKVLISELSGSESLIHFTNGDLNWVSLSEGIHQKGVGEQTKLFMNADEFLYFDNNNQLVGNV